MLKKTTPLGPFLRGVNNVERETDIPDESIRSGVNIDITASGTFRRRTGYTLLKALTKSHSLYSNGAITLLVDDGYLKRLRPASLDLTQLHTVGGYVSYSDIDGTIYYSDDELMRRVTPDGIDLLAWTPNPLSMPMLSNGVGSLVPGKYQVAFTNIGATGEESGADIAAEITVESGGITVTNIPQTTDATHVRIYMTSTGGDVFHAQVDVPMGTTTYTISVYHDGREQKALFTNELPPGHILTYHYGRLYSASDSRLYFSLSLRYGLSSLTDNYLEFTDRITVVMTHPTGLFVAAGEKTYFLAGANPEQMTRVEVYSVGAVEGTGAYVDASLLSLEQSGIVPCWFTANGLVVGAAGGVVLPLTEKQLSPGEYDTGSTLYREENGIRALITSLQGQTKEGFGASDSVSFEVRRNGITV